MTNFNIVGRELSYDRVAEPGDTVKVIGKKGAIRQCFGCNGVGRFAGFAFAEEYYVETWRDGTSNTYRVAKGNDQPLVVRRTTHADKAGSGARIYLKTAETLGTTSDDIQPMTCAANGNPTKNGLPRSAPSILPRFAFIERAVG